MKDTFSKQLSEFSLCLGRRARTHPAQRQLASHTDNHALQWLLLILRCSMLVLFLFAFIVVTVCLFCLSFSFSLDVFTADFLALLALLSGLGYIFWSRSWADLLAIIATIKEDINKSQFVRVFSQPLLMSRNLASYLHVGYLCAPPLVPALCHLSMTAVIRSWASTCSIR